MFSEMSVMSYVPVLAAIFVMLCLLFYIVIYVHRLNASVEAKLDHQASVHETRITKLEFALEMVRNRTEASGQTLDELQRRQTQLQSQQSTMNDETSRDDIYKFAIKMAEKGAGEKYLIDVCGLTDNEAQLLCLFYGERATGNAIQSPPRASTPTYKHADASSGFSESAEGTSNDELVDAPTPPRETASVKTEALPDRLRVSKQTKATLPFTLPPEMPRQRSRVDMMQPQACASDFESTAPVTVDVPERPQLSAVERVVIDYAYQHPEHGSRRASSELRKRHADVTERTIRQVWKQHGLTNREARLRALQSKAENDAIILSASQMKALEALHVRSGLSVSDPSQQNK